MSSSQSGFSIPPFRFDSDQQQPFPHLHHPHHAQQQPQHPHPQQHHHHHSLQQQPHPQQHSQQHPSLQQQQQQHSSPSSHYSHHPNSHGHGNILTPSVYTTTPGVLTPAVNPHTPTDRVISPGSPGRRMPQGVDSVGVSHHAPRRGQESNDSYFTHHPHPRPPHSYLGHPQFQQQLQQQQQQPYPPPPPPQQHQQYQQQHPFQHPTPTGHRHTYPPLNQNQGQHAPPPSSLQSPPLAMEQHPQSQHLHNHNHNHSHHQRQHSLTNGLPPTSSSLPLQDHRLSSHYSPSPSLRPPTPSHPAMLNHHPRVDQGHPQGQTPELAFAPPNSNQANPSSRQQNHPSRHQHHASISSTTSSDQFGEPGPQNRYQHARSTPFSPVGHPPQSTHGQPAPPSTQTQAGGPYHHHHIPENSTHNSVPRGARLDRPSYDDISTRAREDERLQAQAENNYHPQGHSNIPHGGYGGHELVHNQIPHPQQQQQQQQQQSGPLPPARILTQGQGQGHVESTERIDPRHQAMLSNQPHPHPHHVRQLSREQAQMRPQSPMMNNYPLREMDHRQAQIQNQGIHPDDRQQLQHRGDQTSIPGVIPGVSSTGPMHSKENERPHYPGQDHHVPREHQPSPPTRISYDDGRPSALSDQLHHSARTMQPSPVHSGQYQGGPPQNVDPRYQHHRHPSGASMREGLPVLDENRGRENTYSQDERLQQYPIQNLSHQDAMDSRQTPIAQQRPSSAMENAHRGTPHDPRYPPQGPLQHTPPFIGHERRESYPKHPQEPPLAQPTTEHPGADERNLQRPSHMSRGSFDSPYVPVRHPQQEHYPPQSAHPQHDSRESGIIGQTPRPIPPQHPNHSPESRRQTADDNLSFQPQQEPHQHSLQQSQYQLQQPPQPQHQQPHQYYPQHQQGYEQQPVPQESEHHAGRSSFSYSAPPPPPSSQSWQPREMEPVVESGRPIDSRYPRQDPESIRPGTHIGHERSTVEHVEHLPTERMMSERDSQPMIQPSFPPNSQHSFTVGVESIRQGLVSPRDSAFNLTPSGSTRSLSPDTPQAGQKRGRRLKSRMDDVVTPTSTGGTPSQLIPRAGAENLPEQQAAAKKRGRKSKAELEGHQRNWSTGAYDPHHQSYVHADSMVDNSKQDPAGHSVGNDNMHIFLDVSRNGHRTEMDQGYASNGHHERANQNASHQENRFLEEDSRGRPDPRFEQQRSAFDAPSNNPHTAEFEHIQRLRQQQEMQRQQEQHTQHQQHSELHLQQQQSSYSHPQAPGSPMRYENGQGQVQALDQHSGHSALEHERRSGVEFHGQTNHQAIRPTGKEPEMVHRLEADVANALVNIQHENRFQSPDGASYPDGDANKRLRLESPSRPIDPQMGHGHHQPYSQQVDPHSAPVIEPVDRQDLGPDEQDAVILLQSLRNNRQQGDLSMLHQGQEHRESILTEYSNGYLPCPMSPSTRATPRHHDSQSHLPQHEERPSTNQHQYDRRTEDSRMLSPHPSYGHGQPYSTSDPVPFGPHRRQESNDHTAHQRHPSQDSAPQSMHTSQHDPEAVQEHGGENSLGYYPSGSYPTESIERDPSNRSRRSSNNPASYPSNAVQHNDQWRTDSPNCGRNDMLDSVYPSQQRDIALDQQHPRSNTGPQGPWSGERPDNRGPPSLSQPFVSETNAQSINQELGSIVNVVPTKTKTRGKGRSKFSGMISPDATERPDNIVSEATHPIDAHEYDRRVQQSSALQLNTPPLTSQSGTNVNERNDHQAELTSDISAYPGKEIKNETGPLYTEEASGKSKSQHTDSKQLPSGKRQPTSGNNNVAINTSANGLSSGLSERPAPNSLLFGSGMILVKKLHDVSGYGTSSGSEGSTKFPPSQLSIKTGYDLSKTTCPNSSTFSPSTPLSAVATALSVKKKRSKLLDIKDETIATSPGSPNSKGDPLPPPPPPIKGKGGNRGRKGLVLVGSTDADIERSNQITRSGGPAWLVSAASSAVNGMPGVGAGASSASTSVIAAAGTTAVGSSGPVDSPGVRRRPPLSQATLLTENDKRKPKRIKIDDKDVRQVQRTSSTLTDTTDSDRKDTSLVGGKAVADDDDVKDGSSANSRGDGCSNGMSSQRKRLPEEDDEDLGGEEAGRGISSSGPQSRRQSQTQSQGQSQTQNQEQGSQSTGNKTMKRKSSSGLSGAQIGKKAKEKSSVAESDVESAMTNGKIEASQVVARPAATGIPLKRSLSGNGCGSGAATPLGETDVETDLAMEDDIKCPHIFGLDSESEHEIEETMDDDVEDDDSKSSVSTPGRANGDQAGSSSGSKAEGVPDPLDPVQIQGLKWVKTLGMSEKAWDETFKTYERVKRLKELKNRQPVRKRDAILAAILYIVCRDEGSPRTFSEICTASGVRRGDIGAYYRLMLKVLKPSKAFTASARDTDAEAFMTRWCESLALPPQVRQAAIHVFSLANTLNLTSGKCPSSVGAAAIYLCIFSWNNARRLARCKRYHCPGCQGLVSLDHPGADQDEGWIRKEQKDVAIAVGVVSATLMGCFRNLAPESDRLVPAEFLRAAEEGI